VTRIARVNGGCTELSLSALLGLPSMTVVVVGRVRMGSQGGSTLYSYVDPMKKKSEQGNWAVVGCGESGQLEQPWLKRRFFFFLTFLISSSIFCFLFLSLLFCISLLIPFSQIQTKFKLQRCTSKSQHECRCWGLVLKCYELRTRQHKKRLMVNALRPSKHYVP
jgi:hypothetical protein